MEQAIQFEGTGLDLDSNLASMNPGDSPLRINCRVNSSQDSNKGGVQNFRGNTLITKKYGGGVFAQPSGNNQVIGSCKDVERDAIIYFVWNSLGNHQIRRYFTADNSIQLIMQSPLLNFKRTHKIIHADVINDILCWTDGWINPFDEFDYNPPRQIDISKAIGNTQGAPWPNGYPTIDNQVLDAIKYAPGLNPTFNYVNDAVFQDNRLYGHLFQFGYRWIYFDNSISVLSPLSKLTLPQGEDNKGNYVQTIENRLDVTVKTGHFTVVRLELIAFTSTVFKVVDWVDKYDENGGVIIPSNSDYTFQFFNNKYIKTLTKEEALRGEDLLPQVSGAQALLRTQVGAKRAYGQNTEGYANVEDFSMSVGVDIIKIDPSDENYKNISFKRKGAYQVGIVYSDGAGRKSFVQTNDNLRTLIPWWRDSEIVQQYYNPADEWIISTQQKPILSWQINSQPPSWAKYYQVVCTNDLESGSKNHVFYNFGTGTANFEKGYFFRDDSDAVYIPTSVGYEFTEGDRIRIIAQFDNSINTNVKDFGVNQGTNPKMLGYVGALATPTPAFPYQVNTWQTYNDVTNNKWDFKITKFDPTTNLVKIEGDIQLLEQIMYLFQIYNSVENIDETNAQYFEIGESYEIQNGSHTVTSGTLEGIDCFLSNPIYKYQPLQFTGGVVGMRRVFGTGTLGTQHLQNIFLRDVKFGFTAGSPFVLSMTARSYTPPDNANIFGSTSVAAYVPQCSVSNFVESPDRQGINSSFRISSGGMISSLSPLQLGTEIQLDVDNGAEIAQGSTDAVGYFGAPLETKCQFLVPNVNFEIKGLINQLNSYSQFYASDTKQNGRPYVINREAVRKTYTNIRWGGSVIDNSLLNFFSTYYAGDKLNLSEAWNEITRMQVSGDTLKVRQINKATSIYVDRTEILNADGSSNLATANKVLGTTNSSVEVWGGTNGATDQMAVRDTYFFDATNGVVVRDAVNGLIAVSGNKESAADTFKMTSFFRDMGNYVRQNQEYVELHSIYDENTECYILTLRFIKERFMEGEDQIPAFMYKYKVSEAWNKGFTVCFNEPSNRWETFHQYVPEWYGSIGNTLLAFLDGQTYLMYSNEKHNNYFGVQYDTVCAIQSNQKPYTNYIRVYDNIDVYSNDIWYAKNSPDGEDIYILPSSNSPNGMVSELAPETFNAKEGVFHASFLKNKLTPGFPNELLALVDGDMLRGQAMKVVLRNSSENSVFMRQVIVHTTSSEMSG